MYVRSACGPARLYLGFMAALTLGMNERLHTPMHSLCGTHPHSQGKLGSFLERMHSNYSPH